MVHGLHVTPDQGTEEAVVAFPFSAQLNCVAVICPMVLKLPLDDESSATIAGVVDAEVPLSHVHPYQPAFSI